MALSLLKNTKIPLPKIVFFFSFNLIFLTSCTCEDSSKPSLNEKTQNTVSDSHQDISQVADLEKIKIAKPSEHELIEAKAVISSTNGNDIRGTVRFTKVDQGVQIIATIDGLTPGEHGFFIHEFGECKGKDSDSIGAHYNPTHHQHGKPGEDSHVGDLGNLLADEKGHAYYEAINKVIKLQGRNSVMGRSIVIHADRDDYKTQPAGASGVKIGCGVIEPSSD